MWIVIPLALIVIILLFGPVVSGLLMLAAAIGLGAFGAIILLLFGLGALAFVAGAVGWCIWWVFDRRGAMEAYRQALAAREARR